MFDETNNPLNDLKKLNETVEKIREKEEEAGKYHMVESNLSLVKDCLAVKFAGKQLMQKKEITEAQENKLSQSIDLVVEALMKEAMESYEETK